MPNFQGGFVSYIGEGTSVPEGGSTSVREEALSAVSRSGQVRIRTASSLLGGAASSTRYNLGHNYRAHMYGAVREALSLMPKFSLGHPFYLEDGVAAEAKILLSLIEENLEVEAPQVFPQDDETLVLKWAYGKIERLMSITETELTILERNADSKIKCLHEDNLADGFNVGAVFASLGNLFSTSTQVGGDDA